MFSKFWGSLSTTSEGVRKKMNETIADQLKNRQEINLYLERKQPVTNRVILFDEIGLAEKAQDNPLKVLHSYLDPDSEDVAGDQKHRLEKGMKKIDAITETNKQDLMNYLARNIGFIGISNWRLDSSKSNRMIFVARPKMKKEDLT